MVYNRIMKMTTREFSNKFRSIVGDSTQDVPDEFIINALNWAFLELPLNPKLDKAFAKNRRANIPVGHYRFNLLDKKVFRRLTDVPVFTLWTSTGGDLCPLKVCAVTPQELYAESVPSLMKSGRPCKYTIEQEDDNLYLVFDRPTDEPIVIQYTAYGFPKTVKSMNDEIQISAVMENAILEVMRVVWYREADDLSFAGSAYDYLDNKYIPQIIQMVNKTIKGIEGNVILGV